MPHGKIKHIFSDMDGTLLDSTGRLPDITKKIILDSQMPITLASARAPIEMRHVINELDLRGPQIAFNGGLIFQKSAEGLKLLIEHTIDLEIAFRVITVITTYFPSVSLSFYDQEQWYVPTIDEGVCFQHYLTKQIPTIVDWQSFCAVKNNKIYKIMLVVFEPSIKKALYQFLHELEMPRVSICQSGEFSIEITDSEANKAHGIQYVMKRENLSRWDVAGFGDNYNDISMLQLVGVPIVMDNAPKEIKEKALFITTSNDDNGVGYGIVNYLSAFK